MAVEIASYAGRDDLAQRWTRQQNLLAGEFPKAFWDEERGYFCDVPVEEKKAVFSQQAQAAAIFRGLIDEKAGTSLLVRVAVDTTLVPIEAYFSYFWIEAMTRSELEMEALRFIRWRWGTMVDAGATSAWGIWKRVSGDTHVGYWHNAIASSCHGYSGTPARRLMHQLPGLRPGAASEIILEPHTFGLTEAAGTLETAHGPITIWWQRKGQVIILQTEAAAGITLHAAHTIRDGFPIIGNSAGWSKG